MADYNSSNRHRDDDRSSSFERKYDKNWDRNHQTRDEYRGDKNGNRDIYSSGSEGDYRDNKNDDNLNDDNEKNRENYATTDKRNNSGGFSDPRDERYNDNNRRYPNDNNDSNGFYRNDRNNRRDDMNNIYTGGSNYGGSNDYDNYNARHNNYSNDRYRSAGARNNSGNNDRPSNDRDWWDKTKDEVASWFGDDDAERRRRRDEMRNGEHRGKGPKNYTRSEERIREDVSDQLSEDSFLDASRIEVLVKDGDVTLNGHVDSRYSKHRAEDLAEDVTGVKHVQNNLRVEQDSDNVINKSAMNNGDKNITSNATFNTTKNQKESSKV